VSQYQKGKTNLDFTEARDSEWQMPFLPANRQRQSTEGSLEDNREGNHEPFCAIVFLCFSLGHLASSVLSKILAGKNISEVTYFYLGYTKYKTVKPSTTAHFSLLSVL